MKIIIIGPRSVGKSTVGNVLGREMKIGYFDFDKYVEKELNGIDSYVERFGVDSYRIEEERILVDFVSKLPNGFVVSVGGGTVASQLCRVSERNSLRLKEIGRIVYLSLSGKEEEIIDLLFGRELLRKGNKTREDIAKLFRLRESAYESIFDIKIISNKKSAEQVAEEIISKV